jgi:ribosome hibernation promoting factor
MKLQMQSVHFDADPKLLDFIQKKADKLETFYDRIIGGDVFLKLEKGSERVHTKIVEIKLNIPGQTLFSKNEADSFEAATDEAMEALRKQLQRYKDKNYVHH